MHTRISLKFFLNESKNNPQRATIYLRITIDRKKAELATSFRIPHAEWDELRQRARTNPQINQELSKLENKIYQLSSLLESEERPVSARILKDMITDKDKVHAYLIEYYDQFISEIAANPELSPETISLYRQTFNYVERFVKEVYKSSDILIKQVDYIFVTRLDQFFLQNKLKRNTINKHHSRFRTLIHRTINEGRLSKNPYKDFTLKKEKVDRQALSKVELQQLMEHKLGDNLSLQKVRDIFVFSVYTGLRYQDAQDLEVKDIQLKENGKEFICIKQHKTGEDLEIPVLAPAREIIDRYDNDERKITGKILPKFSNQKINAYLKVIADLIGIKKKLTHHVARHTCATTVLLSNDVPLKAVSRWLGHSNVRQTETYAKISSDYLGKIADDINGKI
jgi:integrase/recombinase XerD